MIKDSSGQRLPADVAAELHPFEEIARPLDTRVDRVLNVAAASDDGQHASADVTSSPRCAFRRGTRRPHDALRRSPRSGGPSRTASG